MRYTAALDGLRAVAVFLVMLFHAKAQFFWGGFFGVDVFFVLSGFLITALLMDEIVVLLIGVPISIVIAALSYHYVELPVRRFARSRLNRNSQAC